MERMHPMTAVELGGDFRLDEAIRVGLMPYIWDKDGNAQAYLEGYIEVYLQQEIAQEGIVRQHRAIELLQLCEDAEEGKISGEEFEKRITKATLFLQQKYQGR